MSCAGPSAPARPACPPRSCAGWQVATHAGARGPHPAACATACILPSNTRPISRTASASAVAYLAVLCTYAVPLPRTWTTTVRYPGTSCRRSCVTCSRCVCGHMGGRRRKPRGHVLPARGRRIKDHAPAVPSMSAARRLGAHSPGIASQHTAKSCACLVCHVCGSGAIPGQGPWAGPGYG